MARESAVRIRLTMMLDRVLDEPTNHLDMESVQALIEGLSAFKGGIVLVSHDQRLLHGLGCELWVCGRGLRVESRGFSFYRDGCLRAIEARAAAAEVRPTSDCSKRDPPSPF